MGKPLNFLYLTAVPIKRNALRKFASSFFAPEVRLAPFDALGAQPVVIKKSHYSLPVFRCNVVQRWERQ
jgi:hypothetical protein